MISQAKGEKVFVGLSGGVDSAVSLALLKHSGYDVTGVFFSVWQPDWIECSSKEDRRDAMRVAATLGVPFVTLNLESEYKHGVIDYMIHEYGAGRTPNPDVMCNREVKFGAFLKWAKSEGADYIATGHYARVQKSGSQYRLLAGSDRNKDQSYFLWTLNQDDLSHTLFPVGAMTKDGVRKLARKFRLPNAEKKDSQGLCFIGKVDVKEFLSRYIQKKEGDVLNEEGEVIGRHPGSFLFTLGERHGFSTVKKSPSDAPYYVIDKDVERNTLTASNSKMPKSSSGFQREIRIDRANWVSGELPPFDPESRQYRFEARTRYREPLAKIRIISANFSETRLEFEKAHETITPGQSLVLYRDGECLGGGVIAG